MSTPYALPFGTSALCGPCITPVHARLLAPFLALALLGVFTFSSNPAAAEVRSLEIERREPLLGGQAFGERGAYEMIQGRVQYAFDPASEANARVSDLALAPRDAQGKVVAEGDFLVLQAIDPAKRSGTALIDVPNRGRRLALASLNLVRKSFMAPATLDPGAAADWGDGFLMKQGLTVIWVGWQADAPAFPGSMSLDVPRATASAGSGIRGPARSDWVVDQPQASLPLAVLGHTPNRVADRNAKITHLTRRAHREAAREPVPRRSWRFNESGDAIETTDAAEAFEAGWIYELVYESADPPLVGLGFAAYRDFAAYVRNENKNPFPVQRTVAIGTSQSGRFLRHLLYEGFTQDEAGRPVLDGVIVQIGGAGRGGFNHRFSHPGRVGNPYANFFYPGDEAPFTSRPSKKKPGLSFRKAGLLDRIAERAEQTPPPRIFQINTGYEYWGRAASLVHMTLDGKRDVAPLEYERLYHVASAPHYALPFPPDPKSEVAPGLYRGSSIDTSPAHRALVLRMLDWVERDIAPPASNHPTLKAGTLLAPEALRYPLADLRVPRSPHVAYPLDFGPKWKRGIITQQPPRVGPAYAIRVPAIDALGNEASGVRGLELRVPIGTYTPWALRTGFPGATDEMVGYLGSFVPLARNEAAKPSSDLRPSLASLYPTQSEYDRRVEAEADAMIAEGWMLPEDRERAVQAADARWDWITRNAP
ncbi:MAG: alpha/beta hydrolase domain-containing protein [Myxococcota bacterium]